MDVRRHTAHIAMLTRRPRVPQAHALQIPGRHRQGHLQEQPPHDRRVDGRVRALFPQDHARIGRGRGR